MTILFQNLQITRSDIRPHIKWAVGLVIVYMVTLIFLRGVCVGMYGLTYSLYRPRGERKIRTPELNFLASDDRLRRVDLQQNLPKGQVNRKKGYQPLHGHYHLNIPILIYQGVYCCTKVCNLHLDDSLSKSRDNRMH